MIMGNRKDYQVIVFVYINCNLIVSHKWFAMDSIINHSKGTKITI